MIQAISMNIISMEAGLDRLTYCLMAGFRPPYHKSVAKISQLKPINIASCSKYAQSEQMCMNNLQIMVLWNKFKYIGFHSKPDSKAVTLCRANRNKA